MMPMMWMLMAQTIMSAITTLCFSLSRACAGERSRSKQHATAGPLSGATARGRYTKPRLHHGFHGSAHLPASWWRRLLAFLLSIAPGVLDSLCHCLATKIGWRRYKVYKKWQEHNLHP